MTPQLLDTYTTRKSSVTGVIVEIVPNRTGSLRLRLITTDMQTRWTTWLPKEGE